MASLTPAGYAEMLQKLDEVCRRAQDLAKAILAQMVAQAEPIPTAPTGRQA